MPYQQTARFALSEAGCCLLIIAIDFHKKKTNLLTDKPKLAQDYIS
jgi:hypothetical protein